MIAEGRLILWSRATLKAISSAVASHDSPMKAADNGKTAKLRESKKDNQSAGAQVPHMI